MNFEEFSMNESSDWDEYYGNTRETKLGRTLQDIANDLRQETRKTGEGELRSSKWLLARGLSSLFGLGAKISDGKKGKKKFNSEEENKRYKQKIEVEREWEEFVRNSEKTGISRFGKDWSLTSPRNEEERRYTEKIRRRERELISKMTK